MADTKISDATLIAASAAYRVAVSTGTPGEEPKSVALGGSDGIAGLASGGGLPLQLPIIDGRYYVGPDEWVAATNIFGIGDWDGYIVATPFIAGESKTWTEIGVCCSTANAGDVGRIGIYADDNGIPGALVVDAGELDFSATDKLTKTISQALSSNTWYWRAVLCSGSAASLVGFNITDNPLCVFINGVPDINVAGYSGPGILAYGAQAYGALPATFPFDGYDTNGPLIWLRTGV